MQRDRGGKARGGERGRREKREERRGVDGGEDILAIE